MDVDALLKKLGQPGLYHLLVTLLLYMAEFPVAVSHLSAAIHTARIPHHCRLPAGFNLTTSVPLQSDGTYSSCRVYKNYSKESNETELCPNGWIYTMRDGESTLVTEFDLVCDRAYLAYLSITIYFIGVMGGGIGLGSLADRLGRKPCLLVSVHLYIGAGVVLAIVPTFSLYVVVRFIQGALVQWLQMSFYVLLMELFVPEQRTVVAAASDACFGLSIVFLGGLAYAIPDWRHLQIAITLPSLAGISYIWLVPESVRWLASKGKFDQARRILGKMARFNKVSLPDTLLEDNLSYDEVFVHERPEGAVTIGEQDSVNGDEEENNRKYSVLDLFRTPKIRKRTLVLTYCWLVIAIGAYGVSLAVTAMPGNKYVNLMLVGLVELPVHVVAVYVLQRFGRKKPLCVYLLQGGTMFIASSLIYAYGGPTIEWLSTALALFGKMGMGGCFSIIQVFTCELYPTVTRNIGLGHGFFWARAGGVIVPQIILLGNATFESLPVLLIGGMVLLASFLALSLPETVNRRLPDTVQDIEGTRGMEGNICKKESTAESIYMPVCSKRDSQKKQDVDLTLT